jgi:hypothetical protein
MRLTEIDENLLQWSLDAVRQATKGVRSKSRMAQAKANPPKDNSSRRQKPYKNKCGKWDDPKTTGCVR